MYIKIDRNVTSANYGIQLDTHYQDLYAAIMGVSSFVCALLANLISGIIISYYEKKSEWTIPLICVIKAAIDIPFCLMSYLQVSNFPLYMAGNIL